MKTAKESLFEAYKLSEDTNRLYYPDVENVAKLMEDYANQKVAEALAVAVHSDQPVMIPLDEVMQYLDELGKVQEDSSDVISCIKDHFESQREFWANRDQLRLENQ
jgi:hypothetical protein